MLDKLFGGVWSYVIMAALAVFAIWYVYDLGGDNRQLIFEAKIATIERNYASAALAEGTRQANANQDAKAKEAITLAIIEAQSEALTQKQKELSDAADQDADRDRVCLSDGSRLRIDSIH